MSKRTEKSLMLFTLGKMMTSAALQTPVRQNPKFPVGVCWFSDEDEGWLKKSIYWDSL